MGKLSVNIAQKLHSIFWCFGLSGFQCNRKSQWWLYFSSVDSDFDGCNPACIFGRSWIWVSVKNNDNGSFWQFRPVMYPIQDAKTWCKWNCFHLLKVFGWDLDECNPALSYCIYWVWKSGKFNTSCTLSQIRLSRSFYQRQGFFVALVQNYPLRSCWIESGW